MAKAITETVKTTTQTVAQAAKEKEDLAYMSSIEASTQAKLTDIRTQAAEARVEGANAEIADLDAKIADPPKIPETRGSGKNMKTVMVVDEKALQGFKDDKAAAVADRNSAQSKIIELTSQSAEATQQSDVARSDATSARSERQQAISEGQSQLAALRSGQDLTQDQNDGREVRFNKEDNTLDIKLNGQETKIDLTKPEFQDKSLDEVFDVLIKQAEESLESGPESTHSAEAQQEVANTAERTQINQGENVA